MAATKKITDQTKKELTEEKVDEVKSQLETEMEDKIKTLENQIALLIQNATASPKSDNDPDRDIVVVSLTRGELNLCTEGHGHGDIYTFKSFGDEAVIPYSDLKLIIKKNKSFATGGFFYICDQDMVESQRLKKVYEKIISKEQFEELFAQSKTNFANTFSKMLESQQDIFADMLVDKLVDDEDIDANIVNIAAEKTGKKIYDLVKMQKKENKKE